MIFNLTFLRNIYLPISMTGKVMRDIRWVDLKRNIEKFEKSNSFSEVEVQFVST